jgi:pimeloyl-ACP methyl ester carboxylesterase
MSSSSIVSRIAHQTFLHTPSTMPEGLWWEHLESNFADRPEGFELEPRDWLRVNVAAGFDRILRFYGGTLLTGTLPGGLIPEIGWNGLKFRETPEDWAVYRRAVLEGEPRKFFKQPPAGIQVTTYDPRWGFFVPVDGKVEGLKFESPYEPFHEGMRATFDSYDRNRTARARYWRHDDGPRPTLLAIHGFMADPYWLNERFFSLQNFYEQGYDIMLFTLPHHGLRAERGSLYSGQGFFSAGLGGVNEHMGQAICDLRVLLRYLREERGVTKIGVTGVSLGGWTTALLASLEDSIEFAIPNVPVVSPVDLILEWPPAGLLVRAGLFLTRWSIKNMREVLAVTTPLTYRPAVDSTRLMIIGGVGDRLAPPKHSRLLWDHWDRCQIHWFPGNHVLHLDRGEYLAHMRSFMERLEFLGEPPARATVRHLNSVPA